jgi:hypothetical protein
MNLKFSTIFLAIIFTVVLSCSDSEPLISSNENTGGHLRVIIKWPGDDFAATQDLETRNKIAQVISDRGIGKILRSGTGMGWMDIVVEVKNKAAARIEIEELVKEISPNYKSTIQEES